MEWETGKFYHVSPRIKLLWSFTVLCLAFTVWLIMSVGSLIAFPHGLFSLPQPLLPVFFFFIIGVFLIPYLIWVEIHYRHYVFAFMPSEFVVKKGFLRVESIAVPYENIQNVNVSQSFVERILALATIKIETAGGSTHANVKLEGVSHYEEFVDFLLEKVEESKIVKTSETSPPSSVSVEELWNKLQELEQRIKKLEEKNKTKRRKKKRGES